MYNLINSIAFMRVFYAPFWALEKKFVSYAASLESGPRRRVLVLCPSGRVGARLRRRLTQQAGLISNVFFMTFSQLLARLDVQNPAEKAPLLPADTLHDYILKNLLFTKGLDLYKPSRGFTQALHASLRDLADSLADPDVLEEHLQTTSDPILEAQMPHLRWLVSIYRAYLQKMDGVRGYRSYRQYFQDALDEARGGSWPEEFAEILVYGFYELTGRQLELFDALRARRPMTLFWPYAKHPAFVFGQKFFEANILGAAEEAQEEGQLWDSLAGGKALKYLFAPQAAAAAPRGVRFVSAPDPEGEVFFAVKEMLRLHEEEGLAYSDMALTARSLEPYKTLLPDVFAQNGVPLNAALSFGFAARPLGVFLTNLFSVARGGFDRENILAVVTSPYFKKKNQWRYLIEQCLAKRDYAQWTDLVRPSLPAYDPDFLSWLEDVKRRLEFLERPAEWQTLLAAARELVGENLQTDGMDAEEQGVWKALQKTLDGFVRYGAAQPRAREGEFLDELFSALQDVRLPYGPAMENGVTAADVPALRGQAFKAVFILGLNEKSFPQAIREDPVLKDYYRRILRDQLGFWINQKMERFDEERLLFFCALEMAEERLYLSFLRADAEGKPLVPSGYLAEFARAAGTDLNSAAVRRISGRLSERLKETQEKYLTEKEMSLLLAAEGAEEEQYRAAGLWNEARADAWTAAKQIASAGVLTQRDGLALSGKHVFFIQNEAGFSPSALQDLSRCPMKYFLAKGIGLKEPDEILSRDALAPDARGRAYHEILKDYYKRLYEEDLSGQLFPAVMTERLDASVNRFYDRKSYRQFGIYPVIWELILKDMRDKLADFVVQDAEHLESFVPSVFETEFEKLYPVAPELEIKLRGIVDRIDVNGRNKTFRVLDYKSGRLGGKDLAADMFKKIILQPFIYILLVQDSPQTRGLKQDGAALLAINKGYSRQELSADGFESVRPRADAFLKLLMELINGGSFFVEPGEHCQYCPYAAVCRKDAYRTLLRVRHTPAARRLKEAKQ